MRLSGRIVAALETGCRRGELLGLQWGDVNLPSKKLIIRAENGKDGEVRTIPISARWQLCSRSQRRIQRDANIRPLRLCLAYRGPGREH